MMFWRSRDILQFPEWALVRGLYKSMGYSDYDLSRPLIGLANSWNRVVPGHYNLNLVADYVKQGIFQGGGTPVEFGAIAACDGIAQGHDGMHYILPTRDLIANDIEMMIGAHRLDGVVLLGSWPLPAWTFRRSWFPGGPWRADAISKAGKPISPPSLRHWAC
jgi:dihydroxy-acid dehydratase